MFSSVGNEIWLPLAILVSSLVSEDAATTTAALLAAQGKLGGVTAFASAFLGIWIGDLGLFAISRRLSSVWSPRVKRHDLVTTVQSWFEQHGAWALVFTRFVPGTRFLTYVTAGTSRMSAAVFAIVTGICALLWVGMVFVVTHQSKNLTTDLPLPAGLQLAIGLIAILSLYRVLQRSGPALARRLAALRQWEFWPAWLFYPPVALMCVWLGFRYRGLALPSAANPGQKNGGMIGESKIEILDELRALAPEYVAPAYLIPSATPRERSHFLRHIAEANDLSLPVVLKPNTGQRGAGYCKLTRWEDAEAYFASVPQLVVLQEYLPGPQEAGILYYRLPGETQGKIFSITHKDFPILYGDGCSTLEELIHADRRAALIATTYLRRFEKQRHQILSAGEAFRLVEAGNHCQGCVFRKGEHLLTAALEKAIDKIARQLPGFYIGRFDIRYSSAEELRQGTGFKILELNGAASEATDIYDPGNSLFHAYRTLYRQWSLVYQIGSMNRARGARTSSVWEILVDWLRYQQQSASYRMAD